MGRLMDQSSDAAEEGSQIGAFARKKKNFAFIFSYQDGLSRHFRIIIIIIIIVLYSDWKYMVTWYVLNDIR